MSLAQGNNTQTRPRIEPGSPDPESDALTTRPVRSPNQHLCFHYIESAIYFLIPKFKSLIVFCGCKQPGLCRTLLEIPKTGFLMTGLNYVFRANSLECPKFSDAQNIGVLTMKSEEIGLTVEKLVGVGIQYRSSSKCFTS